MTTKPHPRNGQPVGLETTDHVITERVNAPRRPGRVEARFRCERCHRREDSLVWFIRDPCPGDRPRHTS